MITIPELEYLPNNCHECPFSYWDDECECWCPWHNCVVDYHDGDEKRMYGCPLAESADEEYYTTSDMSIESPKQEPIYYPPCIDCNKKMDEIRRAYDNMITKEIDQEPVLEKIRAEIEEQVLESLSDGGDDWFAAEKVNECLDIIKKYKTERDEV